MEQGSAAWFALRTGKVTASKVSDVVGKTQKGWAAPRALYMGQLVAERLTDQISETFVNPAMRWGTEQEPFARAAYSFLNDVEVEEIAFVAHPTIAWSGASPDGLIGKEGGVEFKCPTSATHIETILGGICPEKHVNQIQWQMACTGRLWWDFASFDPRMPEEMQLFVRRVARDDAYIAELEQMVIEFLGEIDDRIAILKALTGAKDARKLALSEGES